MTTFDAHKNFVYSTVATAPSPAASGTSLTVAAGDGARMPAAPFNLTIWPTAALALATNAEIVRVTNVAGDVLTITRAQEGTSARTVVVGDQVVAAITKAKLDAYETAINARAGTGLTTTTTAGTAVVGTNDSNGLSLGIPTIITNAITTQTVESQSIGMSTQTAGGATAGTAGYASGGQIRYHLAAGSNITLSQSINGGSGTLSIFGVAPAGGAVNFSAGTTSNNLGSVVFSNINGVSFGLNGSTMTASVDPTSSIVGTSGISISTAGNTVTLALTASNANGVSFGFSGGSVLTGSVLAQTVESQSIGMSTQTAGGATGGTTGYASGGQVRYHFVPGSNITLSQSINGASGTLSIYGAVGAAATGISGIIVSDATYTSGTVSFSNQNGVTIGSSVNGATQFIRLSVANQSNQTAGMYALGNTTQNSSTTFDARTLGSFSAAGALTVGFSNGTIQLSAAPTSSLAGAFGLTVSSNGSTISVQPTLKSDYQNQWPGLVTIAGSNQANSSVSVVPFDVDWPINFSQFRVLASVSGASAANTSSASQAYSLSVVVYSMNGSTLSSIWSGQQSSNSFWQSNSTTQLAGVRALVATGVGVTLNPGRYYAAVHLSTTNSGTGGNTTALGASYSMLVGLGGATAAAQADNWNGGATNASRLAFPGLGIYSTGATRATIDQSVISGTGNSLSLANLYVNPRNASLF